MIKSKHIVSAMTRDTELNAGLALKYDASNPNGYETPAQLNARDVASKARGNHTGTQLSSTISDLDSTVRGTLLSGLSTVTNAVIAATDNILVAMGKLQAQISGLVTSKYDASNPNSYETTTQLNARDTANRSRANHTGTILSTVVSDFIASVRSVTLTGISLATSTDIVATDTILEAFGKIQARLNLRSVSTIPANTGLANSAGTSTAFARADHVHNTVTDIGRLYQTVGANTSGTAYTAITGFNWVPNAGSYVTDFNCAVSATGNNTIVRAALFRNGVQVPDSEMEINVRAGAKDMLSGGAPSMSFNGTTDSVELRIAASTGVVTTTNRILKITRVG